MEKNRKKANLFFSLCAWAGLSIVALMFLAVAARFFTRTVLVGMLGVPKDAPIVSKLLKNRMKNDFEEELTVPHSLADVKNDAALLTSKAQSAIEDDLLGRSIITRVVNRTEGMLGVKQGVFDGEMMYDLDGYLVWATPEKTEESIATGSENVLKFRERLREMGLEMLYVMMPQRIDPADWPSGTVDFTLENHNAQAAWLKKNSVETLDLNAALTEDGFEQHTLFFRTDHHWKPSAGLWASKRIAETLSERYGLAFDTSVLEPERYRVETCEKAFLGSMGKKITEQKIVPDDLEIWMPTYETALTVSFVDRPAEHGDFSLLYDMNYYDPCTPLSDQDPYSVYLRGNLGRVTIENALAKNDTRLLIVGDSFDNVLVPFLSQSVRSVDVFDLRNGGYGKKFWSCIEDGEYDIALVMTGSLRYALE